MEGEIEITIQSILPSDEPQGRFQLKIQPNVTVDSLLQEICRTAKTTLKAEYCLRSKANDALDRTKTLTEVGIQNGTLLHWTFEGVDTKEGRLCNVFLFLAVISFLIGAAGFVAICVLRFKTLGPVEDYAITFDAGSTHTSMFIYKWEGSKFKGTALAAQNGEKCDVKGSGGIASFENNTQAAGKSLEECLQMAKNMIPSDKHSSTPIYLGATAGMRILNETNPKASDAILDSVRETFTASPFQFTDPKKSVRIISGSEEGSFSWITSNYVTNAFGVDRPGVKGMLSPTIVSSVGALDLGGASTQITFQPSQDTVMPPGFSRELRLYGRNYTIYTHSFLCYGVMEVTKRIQAALIKEHTNLTSIPHPCLPSNYSVTVKKADIFGACVSGQAALENFGFIIPEPDDLDEDANVTFYGESNGTQCRSLLNSSLFDFSSCPYPHCSFNGIYQPLVQGPFYAFSSYYYVTAFLNLTTSNSTFFEHSAMKQAINNICAMDWQQLQEIPTSGKTRGNLPWYCLQSTYMDLLLYDGYNFTDAQWSSINFVSMVSKTGVGWSLGFVLNESLLYPVDTASEAIGTVTFALLVVLMVLFIIVGIAMAVTSRRSRVNHQPKYKRLNSYGAI